VLEDKQRKSLKKKEITCFRHKKMGQNSNECEEELGKTFGSKQERTYLLATMIVLTALHTNLNYHWNM